MDVPVFPPEPSPYLMVHLLNRDNPLDFGQLLCLWQAPHDGVSMLIPLYEFFEDVESEDAELIFLSSSLMMALFAITSDEDDIFSLHVVNLLTRHVDDIAIPLPELFNLNFYPWENVVFRANSVADYQISVVGLGYEYDTRVPRYCIYDSRIREWRFVCATPLQVGEDHFRFVNHDQLLHIHEGTIYQVSRRWNEDLHGFSYSVTTFDALATQAFSLITERDFDPVEVEEGLVVTRSHHHGRDGYAVMSQRESLPRSLLSRLNGVALFEIAEDWSTYLHVSTVPSVLIPRHLLRDFRSAPYVLEENERVHIVYAAPSGDHHEAVSIVHFTYRPGFGWECRTSTLRGPYYVRNVGFGRF